MTEVASDLVGKRVEILVSESSPLGYSVCDSEGRYMKRPILRGRVRMVLATPQGNPCLWLEIETEEDARIGYCVEIGDVVEAAIGMQHEYRYLRILKDT